MTRRRVAPRVRERLGIQAVERTFSGCRLVFTNPSDREFLSIDVILRDDLLRKWAHVAIPVHNKEPGFPIFAGIVTPKSFNEVEEGFKDMAKKYAGLEYFCVEGLEPQEIPYFVLDPWRDAQVSLLEIETAWKRVLTILMLVFGRF